jgi:hypothetical protein
MPKIKKTYSFKLSTDTVEQLELIASRYNLKRRRRLLTDPTNEYNYTAALETAVAYLAKELKEPKINFPVDECF